MYAVDQSKAKRPEMNEAAFQKKTLPSHEHRGRGATIENDPSRGVTGRPLRPYADSEAQGASARQVYSAVYFRYVAETPRGTITSGSNLPKILVSLQV